MSNRQEVWPTGNWARGRCHRPSQVYDIARLSVNAILTLLVCYSELTFNIGTKTKLNTQGLRLTEESCGKSVKTVSVELSCGNSVRKASVELS